MRKLLSRDEAVQMISEIPKVKGRWISDDRERERTYKEAIFNGNYGEMMELLAGLFEKRKARIKQGKRQTELDDRIFRNTKRVFLGELAIALDTDAEQLEKEIGRAVAG